jgi:hypothetical protein
VSPEDVARILDGYGMIAAGNADQMIDLARRALAPPGWLARHAARMSCDTRDVLLVEAESTLARLHGFRTVPFLAQTESYFRAIAAGVFPGSDPAQEWDLLSCRQAHRPSGVTRLLDLIIDEGAFDLPLHDPGIMAYQIRCLLRLADRPHVTVRVIPEEVPVWEQRTHDFGTSGLAGTSDRIGIVCYPVIGYRIADDDFGGIWADLGSEAAVDAAESKLILRRRLAAL